MSRIVRGGKEWVDDPNLERRKECKGRKAKDGWPEVGKEEGERKERVDDPKREMRERNAKGGKERMDGPKREGNKECNGRKGWYWKRVEMNSRSIQYNLCLCWG